MSAVATAAETLLDHLRAVCHPARFPNMSLKMAALLAYLLDVADGWTSPVIQELAITSDGVMIAYTVRGDSIEGDVGDLRANLRQLHAATQGTAQPMSDDGLAYLLAKVDGLGLHEIIPIGGARTHEG